MRPTIRPFLDNDAHEVAPLLTQLGYPQQENVVIENVKLMRTRQGEVFVALIDDVIVGCLAATYDVRLAEGPRGEIVSLVVAEHRRGQGVGKQLVASAEQWLKNLSSKIIMRTNTRRAVAHEFYNRLGYLSKKTQTVFEKKL
jgi:GNAT superfamily N-acetyltransferase